MDQSAPRSIADNRFLLRLLFHSFATDSLSQLATQPVAPFFPQENAVELLRKNRPFYSSITQNFRCHVTQKREFENCLTTSVECPYQTLLIRIRRNLTPHTGDSIHQSCI